MMKSLFLTAAAFLLIAIPARAQTDAGVPAPAAEDISELSLEALLDKPIAVATATGTATRAATAPAIVTVITREEIRDLGARDLIDVLRFVPGLDFTSDVEGVVGLAVRGITAIEGKALVMIDGMPINDLSYGNALFGNREAVDQIDHIEVIRGPGSTVYGGFAELAVINVVTHPDTPVDRVNASATYGQLPTTVGRLTGALQASHSFGDLNVRGSVFTGTSVRSDGPYEVAGTGQTVNMAEYSTIRPFNVSLGADWKGVSGSSSTTTTTPSRRSTTT